MTLPWRRRRRRKLRLSPWIALGVAIGGVLAATQRNLPLGLLVGLTLALSLGVAVHFGLGVLRRARRLSR